MLGLIFFIFNWHELIFTMLAFISLSHLESAQLRSEWPFVAYQKEE